MWPTAPDGSHGAQSVHRSWSCLGRKARFDDAGTNAATARAQTRRPEFALRTPALSRRGPSPPARLGDLVRALELLRGRQGEAKAGAPIACVDDPDAPPVLFDNAA